MKTLQDILNQRDLSALFQPVMDISSGAFLGFEGLIRGPADNTLHSPVNLFGAARQQGLSLEVEMLSRQIVLESFAAQNLPGKIFLNVSPDALSDPTFRNGKTLTYLKNLGIDPKRVIIEITENQPTFDFEDMRNALLHYRSMGFQIAMDDLGEGFSSLRLWSELRPEFVKIDMHFVQGVNTDQIKQQFLRSIQGIALSSGTQVIAEGIETEAEFKFIRNIGIACGQGYFIARPSPTPPLNPSAEVGCLVNTNHPAKQPYSNTRSVTVETILRYVDPAQPGTSIEKIFASFSENKNLRAIPVAKNGRPVGLINRYELVDSFAQPYHRELLGKKPCTEIMNAAPLLVEKSTPIHELSGFLSESEIRHFTDGFIITEQGRYIGIGNGQDLLREITKAQIETARYANPLTLLPGNVPINEHIEYLLQSGKSFSVCYGDLDNFKPFNDVCGYRKGDELIQFTARLLANVCDPVHDFIGHIGGDDFILVMQSKDWEQRCHRALSAFARTSSALFDKDHLSMGGYLTGNRQGRIVHHPLPTLSIGAACIIPKLFGSHYEVAAAATAAKKMAKEKPGNSLFIERRHLYLHEAVEEQHEADEEPHEVAKEQHEGAGAYYG
ncbi:MAG: GGDEF domain-containing protein [Gallionella sp.]|nr:GGDEF domain-containing protein [Gallionella sp.]